MDKSLKKRTYKNLAYSFTAQIISISLSILMSLLVPKILGIKDYGYWQLFLFYTTYVGFFHFGITDGMYLKNGGIEYSKIDKKEISSQFYMLLLIQTLMLIFLSFFSIVFIREDIRKIILIYTGVYMLIANLNWYLGYVFQATNRVKYYSISVMIDKIIFIVFILLAFIFKIKNIYLYIPIFISTTLCALIFSIVKSWDIIKTKPYSFKESFKLSLSSAKIGINLTLASISSLLIIGVGRFMVDRVWGIESFGKFSLALSLTNFFLLFLIQVSVVLFPTLRQIGIEAAKKMFVKFNNGLDAILPIIYLTYVPIKWILTMWLPQYSVSLDYLGMLLPLCIFDGKNQMINNTYFKVLREEKLLLKVNVIALLISTVLSLISVFILQNIYLVIVSMLIAIAARSIIGELVLYKKMNLKNEIKNTIVILIYSILFIIYNMYLDGIIALVLIIVTFIIYIIITDSIKVYIEAFNKLAKQIIKRD